MHVKDAGWSKKDLLNDPDSAPAESTHDALEAVLLEMRASGETMAAYWAGRIEGVMK